jgi:alginate O-acetyltransferase complex protein AlgI
MLFNSIHFIIFYILVFFLYWALDKRENPVKSQNLLLMFSSYLFYSFWDWRFLLLLVFSTLLDYYSGIMINKSEKLVHRKLWLILSVVINLGFLCVFKYYNFFAESLSLALNQIGFHQNLLLLNVILPVGISFYTFHGLSYVFDIYNRKIQPCNSFINYTLFVSYFPLLVAGPIERATHLLPQIEKKRQFSIENTIDGLRQALWGMFKKVVIADNCATFVNPIFDSYDYSSGSTLAIGAILFAFQIYCDFSGYSDIALGVSRMLGIELIRNFSFPYFSKDIGEFWRKWHISLSSWFRDYLYYPLGGSKLGKLITIRNTLIIFLVSGFWHGANLTFIVWGLYHALLFIPLLIFNLNKKDTTKVLNNNYLFKIIDFFKILLTFILVVIGWVFFRSKGLLEAFNYLSGIFNISIFTYPKIDGNNLLILTFIFILIMLFMEWIQRSNTHGLNKLESKFNTPSRFLVYFTLIWIIVSFHGNQAEFIYFQF